MWFSIDSTFLALPFMRELRSKKTKGDSRGNDRAFVAIEIICFSLDAPVKREHFRNKDVFDALIDSGILTSEPGGYSAKSWLKSQKRLRSRDIIKTMSVDRHEAQPAPDLKRKYLDNVTLSISEEKQLISDYGDEFFKRLIYRLSAYKRDSGKTYKSDYDAILRWVVGAVKQDIIKETSNPKISDIDSTEEGRYRNAAKQFSSSKKGREYKERLKKILGE